MAQEKILDNLNSVLKKPLQVERVMYLMAEIRKYITKNKEIEAKYQDLKYWCDWALHPNLDRTFAKKTLNKMEQYIINNPDKKFHESSFNHQFISLEGLKCQLEVFLTDNNLPIKIVNGLRWHIFSKHLIEILSDCPLEKTDGFVRKFFFTKKDHLPEIEDYSIDWELNFNDNRRNLYGSVLYFKKS